MSFTISAVYRTRSDQKKKGIEFSYFFKCLENEHKLIKLLMPDLT